MPDMERNRSKPKQSGCLSASSRGIIRYLPGARGGLSSNNNAILAARLAYFLNLSGPVMAIDTACSSGLVAAHQAILSLRAGECDSAIVAGVNLLLTPGPFIGMSQAGMLSEDGKCYAFDKRANGMVPGEAVAAVVFKRLSKAEAAGDPIYAIIKGNAINYDGKTNGITAPSGVSQSELLKAVYNQYRVNPEDIEYIVTHGTGTKLGDPIEINALYEAFKDYSSRTGSWKQGYCALTSTKTNFGHSMAASGLVSLISLVQAIRYATIPASLHCEQENDYINWRESPFYVNKTAKPWPGAASGTFGNGKTRTGAVSAFGMSGTNVHMVVQGYCGRDHRDISQVQASYYILALSAKTQETLVDKIKDLVEALQNKEIQAQGLLEISYTLLMGRQHFSYRCAIVIQDQEDAVYVLKQAGGKEKLPNLFQGKVPRDFTGQKAIGQYIRDLLDLSQTARTNKTRYQEILFALADLFCQGYEIDWKQLYGDTKMQRIHLPAYPFTREYYWVSNDVPKSISNSAMAAFIHPLLHQNTANLSEQRFSSTFTGEEFFFTNHAAKDRRILPGVACLEMARAAVEQAVGSLTDGLTGIRLHNVVWGRSIIAGTQPVSVHISLYPEDNHKIDYEIYSESVDEIEPVLYSHGNAMLTSVINIPTLDLNEMQARCNQTFFSAAEIYAVFQRMGIDYDPAYQGIEAIFVGSDQVLAKLSLPASVSDTKDQFVLHPSIMDSAIQATLGFMIQTNDLRHGNLTPRKPILPGALQQLEIFGKCTTPSWALIRSSEGVPNGPVTQESTGKADAAARMREPSKVDIDLCDEQGTVWVRISGLKVQENPEIMISETSLQVSPTVLQTATNNQEAYELMTFEEVWQEESLPDERLGEPKTLVCFLSNPENQQLFIETMHSSDPQAHACVQIIFISQSTTGQKESTQNYSLAKGDRNSYQAVFQSIHQDFEEIDAILYLWPLEDSGCLQDYSCIVHILQAIAATKLKAKRILLAAQYKNGLDRCYPESWIGFERSLGLVLPYTQVAAIYQTAQELNRETVKDWVRMLWMELQIPKAQSVFYQDGKRNVCRIRPTRLPIASGKSLVKPGGTYLITGGYGGLGLLFAEYLAKHSRATKPVKLILTGRSPLDAVKQSKIKVLEDLGSQVIYLQADICDPIGMKAGLNQVKESFGSINGVIHAAGVVGKQNIFAKTIPDFQKVLDPKITGTLVLDELLAAEPLNFVCYFSSSAAILGDFGSCDYAVANRFLMAYAHYRNQQRKNGERQGKTIAINWPLWKDGGMGVGDDANTRMYLKSSGQRILEAGEGLDIFDRILAQNNVQQLVIAGQPSRVHRFLGLVKAEPAAAVAIISDSTPNVPGKARGRRSELKGLSLEQCLEWDLKEQISRLLKISRDKLDQDENLADFGFDSINLAQLANQLTIYYEIELTPALFFGYSTIEKLTHYFLTEHQQAIEEFYREDALTLNIVPVISTVPIAPKRMISGRDRFITRTTLQNMQNVSEPIAIIGMSGRFPGARNIDELWQILATGQDMVREIPAERFDWRQYYGNPAEPGKTNCKWCGCIPGVREFEPLFFEISPKEAETMDPRQRLLLQESWRALEDAGYGAKQIQTNKIGMFVGIEPGDYQLLTHGEGDVTSNSNAILASRLAYFLNLNGPVMAIDTACSSGLVAAHQAVLSLRNGECDTAIIAGVNILLTPSPFIGMSQAGMLSEDGKCYAFDKRANGLVPGEAVAVVVFKRLSAAEADGDPIYAVIQGSGINYDGKTNGITAPSGISQTNLLKTVYDRYRVNPEEIEYIVTHGTGTKLGDPVEINALYDAFKDCNSFQGAPRHGASKQGYCALTSTKTNLGHTFAASGLVSLISLVQALRYETIPASLHCEQENDYINWKESPFYVNKTNRTWPEERGKRRTGAVSAFGMSGTNVHMVVQGYCGRDHRDVSRAQAPYYILALSAKTQETLVDKIKDLVEALQNKEIQAQGLLEISYTLLKGRQHFSYRCAVVIQDLEDAVYVLKQMGNKEKLPNLFQGKVPRDFRGQKAIEQYAQDLLTQSWALRANSGKYQELLFALADLYCQGYQLDWNQLFNDAILQRIHLPTYPFAREHYWIEERSRNTENATQRETTFLPLQSNVLFYEQLIDEVLNNRVSSDNAVREIKKLLGIFS